MASEYDGLSLTQLLNLLEPVPEPAPVSMMPQTVGWLWVATAIALLICLMTWRLIRRWRARAYRRAALAALKLVGENPARIAVILRETALSGFPRSEVAGLIGADWLDFLNRTSKDSGFTGDLGHALTVAQFQPNQPEVLGLNEQAQSWVRSHRQPEEEV